MPTLYHSDLGRMEFSTALALQEELLERKHTEEFPDVLLYVEHAHVYTIGRAGKAAHVIAPGETPVIRTSRGGDVTYHGPGQIVAYPIVDLRSKLRKAVHRYLYCLELTTIRTLAGFGIAAQRRPPWTGIWIGEKKIAAIGIAVRRGVTYHGVALNVNTDLSYFRRIIPCGLAWARVTSMAKELDREVAPGRVKQEFLHHFLERFGYTEIKELCLVGIQTGSRPSSREARTTFA